MTVRVALAVAIAVALLAMAAPGMNAAREYATASALEGDARQLATAVDAVHDAPRGSRRVVELTLPSDGVGTVEVERVAIFERAFRYRLASGERGRVLLPAPIRSLSNRDGFVFDSPGTYRFAVTHTRRGVVVSLASIRPIAHAGSIARAGSIEQAGSIASVRSGGLTHGYLGRRGGERLSVVGRPASACSTVETTASARRASTPACSG